MIIVSAPEPTIVQLQDHDHSPTSHNGILNQIIENWQLIYI